MSIRSRPNEPRKARDVRVSSRVNERDHDISCALRRIESLVVVGQSTGMHKHPANLGLSDLAIIAEEATSATLAKRNSNLDFDLMSHLVVNSYTIEGHVDSVGGADKLFVVDKLFSLILHIGHTCRDVALGRAVRQADSEP